MLIEKKESLFFTEEEFDLLNKAKELIEKVYDETYEDEDIVKNALAAQGAIFYLLNVSKLE